MNINIDNGDVQLTPSLWIGKSIAHSEFIKANETGCTTPFVINKEYKSYKINNSIDLLGYKLIIIVYFTAEKLQRINISISLDSECNGWDGWSENSELMKKSILDKFLFESFGSPPYEYSWGRIESIYDKRSGDSGVIISYYL